MGRPIKPLIVWGVGIAAFIALAFFFNVGGLQDFYFGSRYFRPYARLSQEIRGNLVVRLNDDRILLLNVNRSEIFNPKTRLSEFAEGLSSVKAFAQNLNLLALPDNNVLITQAGVDRGGRLHCESSNRNFSNFMYCPIDKTLLFNTKTKKIEWVPYPLRYLEGQSLSLLPDGNVLVTGGIVMPSAEEAYAKLFPGMNYDENNVGLYNPITHQYKILGRLNIPRYNHSAVVLDNGEIMIAGGSKFTGKSSALSNPITVHEIEVFNISERKSKVIGTKKLPGRRVFPLEQGRYIFIFGKWRNGKIYSEIINLRNLEDTVVIEGEGPRKALEGLGQCAPLPNGNFICVGNTEVREVNPKAGSMTLVDSTCTKPLFQSFPFYIPDVGLLVFGNARIFGEDERTVQIFNYKRYLKDLKARENRPSP